MVLIMIISILVCFLGSNLAKATQGIGIIQAGGGIAGMPGRVIPELS